MFIDQYQFNDEIFETSDNTVIRKKPIQYRGDLNVKYNSSQTSLLEYSARFRQENIQTPIRILQNDTDNFRSILDTKDSYLKQRLLFTKKLTQKQAFQLAIRHTFNDIDQKYTLTPARFTTSTLNDQQQSRFKRHYLSTKATLLGSLGKDRYSLVIGSNIDTSPFNSLLLGNTNTGLEPELDTRNDLEYRRYSAYSSGAYHFRLGKWKLLPTYTLHYLKQELNNELQNTTTEADDFIFEPALSLWYTINSNSFLSAKASLNQSSNTQDHLFINSVVADNRRIITNVPSLALRQQQLYSLSYHKNDLFKLFQIVAGLSYKYTKGGFFSKFTVDENQTNIEYFFLPLDNSRWNANVKISKYLSFIESTLEFSGVYSFSEYNNIINNSAIRNNETNYYQYGFAWKTAFDIPIDFENSINWETSISQSENQSAFRNNRLKNSFEVIYKPSKQWVFSFNSDYYLPDTEQSTDFIFLDISASYKPKRTKWSADLKLKNLLNEENFEQIQTSDFSTNIFRSNILPRHFLITIHYTF